MSTTTIEKEPATTVRVHRVKASVGDLIQYRYKTGAVTSNLATRRIIEVHNEGAAFVVDGFFLVAAVDVITVIPMHETQIVCGNPVCIDNGRCVCEERQ